MSEFNGQPGTNGRISFARTKTVLDYPDLLEIQLQAFKEFVQDDVPPEEREDKGLQAVFKEHFPITDSRERYILEFLYYALDTPKHTIEECLAQGLTYSVPLKAKLRLSILEDEDEEEAGEAIEQEVYLGNLPYMTERGTFIINGAERVIVSQLHRSPGVFFSQSVHPNGTELYSARVIPLRGSWLEFSTDVAGILWAYIDRRKKIPVTTLLRALGYSSDEDIIQLFELAEEADISTKKAFKSYIGRKLASSITLERIIEIVDEDTGEVLEEKREREVLLPAEHELQEGDYDRLKEAGITKLYLLKEDEDEEEALDKSLLLNTLRKDPTHSEAEALEYIYFQLRGTEAPDLETARALLDRLFFNEKRYDLGAVGRYRLNKRLRQNTPMDILTLTKEDIVAIVRELVLLQNGRSTVDDIDHLGNRRVRTVAEQLAAQFSVGLARMARTIKERMNLRDAESFTPQDLVNARTIASVINTFFGTNQLSQFMDQTNPLAELTHKRRVSALGPGGLTRERAGFEVRDVHYTHYGRLCPIETPEGPNIGLICSLTVHARINEFGFIETPYRVVRNGKVTNEIVYLTAEEEDNAVIAQANAPIDEEGNFLNEFVKCRYRGDFPLMRPEQIQYMDVAPNQIVSPSASLIPFLEHDDANRALMGSNMQRQAVPLLQPEAPIVGTGMEARVARDSRALLVAEGPGVVEYVDAERIVIRYDQDPEDAEVSFEEPVKEYRLIKFRRTNQDTCINMRPIVKVGQRVEKGTVLCDGFATEKGELALGKNVLVAFMPWRGYNFEDAIVISERLVIAFSSFLGHGSLRLSGSIACAGQTPAGKFSEMLGLAFHHDPHRTRRPGDHRRRLLQIVGVQVGHLLPGDFQAILPRHFPHLLAQRIAGAFLDTGRLLEQLGRRGTLDDKGEGFVRVNRDHDRQDHPHAVLRGRVELLTELHDVDPGLTERGADRRGGRRLATPNLEFDNLFDLLCHGSSCLRSDRLSAVQAPAFCKAPLECFCFPKVSGPDRPFLFSQKACLRFPLHLQVIDFQGRLAPEDGDHHLELEFVGIDFLDYPGEIIERPLDDAHHVAGLERDLGLLAHFPGLINLPENAADLVRAQRRGLISTSQKAYDRGHVGDQMLQLAVEHRLDQNIARKEGALTGPFFSAA